MIGSAVMWGNSVKVKLECVDTEQRGEDERD